jgi:hypothetical protein
MPHQYLIWRQLDLDVLRDRSRRLLSHNGARGRLSGRTSMFAKNDDKTHNSLLHDSSRSSIEVGGIVSLEPDGMGLLGW